MASQRASPPRTCTHTCKHTLQQCPRLGHHHGVGWQGATRMSGHLRTCPWHRSRHYSRCLMNYSNGICIEWSLVARECVFWLWLINVNRLSSLVSTLKGAVADIFILTHRGTWEIFGQECVALLAVHYLMFPLSHNSSFEWWTLNCWMMNFEL